MRISELLNLLLLLVSVAGFSALFLTGTVTPVFTAIFTLSVIAGFIQLKKPSFLKLDQKVLNTALYLVLLFLIADFILTGTELLSTLISLLLVLHSFKLISGKNVRDYQQILLLSFFQVVASCVLTTSFSFGFILVLYLFVSLFALIVMNFKKESEQAVKESETKLDIYALLRFEVLIIIFVLALTSVFFLIMPRFNSEFVSGSFAKLNSIKSGFSEEVTLGRLGEIKSDSSPVMRVYIKDHDPDDLQGPIYWRGIALDEFNGTTWKLGRESERSYLRENRYGEIVVDNNYVNHRDLLKQEIITEPIDTKVLFSAEKPVRFSESPGNRVVSYNSSYSLPDFGRSRIKYQVYSDIRRPDTVRLERDKGGIPPEIRTHFTDSLPISDRFKQFVAGIHEEEKSNYYNVVKVKDYLLNNYKYTRILNEGTELYPIDDFLFEYREGHCEYFASAMVLILREMGIPARIVTGFIGGEFNTHGSFYLVRESNAHAWVEVYFPQNGWVLFDPTPEATGSYDIKNASFVGSYIDYLKFRWSRYVIDFTRSDQLNFLESLNRKVSRTNITVKTNPFPDFSFDRGVLLFLTVLAFSLLFFKNRNINLSVFRGKPDEAFKVYSSLLKKLEKNGIEISAYQTSEELMSEFGRKYPHLFSELQHLIRLYQEIRFGGKKSNSKVAELKRLSRKFAGTLSDQEKHNNNKRENTSDSDQK